MSHAACPHCGHSIVINDFLAGQIAACPACGQRFEVPAGSATITPTPPPVVSGERSEFCARESVRTNPTARRGRPIAISLPFIVAGGVVGIGLAVLILLFVFNIDVLGIRGESRRATAQSNTKKAKPSVNLKRGEPLAKGSRKNAAPTAKVVHVPNGGQSTLLPPALSPVGPDGAIANDEFRLGDPPPVFPDPPPLEDPRDFGPNPPPPGFLSGPNDFGGLIVGDLTTESGPFPGRMVRGMAPGIGAFPDAGDDAAPIDEATAATLIGPLMEALEKGEVPEERARAADELGQLGKHASKAVPLLVKSLKDVSESLSISDQSQSGHERHSRGSGPNRNLPKIGR
ncbi:MAG TPA: hypothetical protein VMP01_29825 [Pirellulaceae bacterium]|nr:hypothetical protein [Pirellulaceae bacterium]